MPNVVQLGPLMFAADRLLAVALLLAFMVAIGKIGTYTGRDTARAALWSLLAGILAARLVYIGAHVEAFSHEWWSAAALWQGGFAAWAGIAAAAVVLLAMLGVNRTSVLSLAVTAALALTWSGSTALLTPEPEPLPNFPSLVALDGKPIEPRTLAGQPYVINLWATWCPPCRREMPMLTQVASSSEVPILLANQGEPAHLVQRFLAQNGIETGSVVLDKDSALMRTIGGGALPTTIFVNARGEVVETHVGEISRAALLDQMQQLKEE